MRLKFLLTLAPFRRLGIALLTILLVMPLTGCGDRVDVGYVGIKAYNMGERRGEVEQVGPGRYWINPFSTNFYTYRTVRQSFTLPVSFNVQGALVSMTLTGEYAFDPNTVKDLFETYRLGENDLFETIGSRALNDCVNEEAPKYQPEQIQNGATRNQLLADVQVCFPEKIPGMSLARLGISGNVELPPTIQDAIERRLQAQQQREQQLAELERQKIENQRQLEQAQTEAEVARLEATTANEQTIQLRTIRLGERFLEKWDGSSMPSHITVLGDGIPFQYQVQE